MAYNRGNGGNQRNSGGQNGGNRGGNRGGRSGGRGQLNYIYAANFTKDLKFETQNEFDAWLNEQYAMLDSLKFEPKMRVHLSFDATEELSINIAPKDIDSFFQEAEKASGDNQGDGGLRMVLYSSRRSNQSTGEEYDGASVVFMPKFNNQNKGGGKGRGSFGGGRGNNGRRDYPDQNSGGQDQGNGQEQSSRGAGNRTTNGSQEQRQSRTNSQQERGGQTRGGSRGGQQEQQETTSHSNQQDYQGDNNTSGDNYTNQEW